MTTFYICRHGETENNKAHRLSGWIDTPLTKEGKLNAATSAKKLENTPIDKIVCSDLGRAVSTAEIITRQIGYTDEIEQSKELREVSYGDMANQPYSAYPDITPEENTNFTPPGGESLAQMQKRVIAKIMELADDNPDKTILVVGHDGTINAVKALFSGISMGRADTTHNAHDSVFRFTIVNNNVTSSEEF